MPTKCNQNDTQKDWLWSSPLDWFTARSSYRVEKVSLNNLGKHLVYARRSGYTHTPPVGPLCAECLCTSYAFKCNEIALTKLLCGRWVVVSVCDSRLLAALVKGSCALFFLLFAIIHIYAFAMNFRIFSQSIFVIFLSLYKNVFRSQAS